MRNLFLWWGGDREKVNGILDFFLIRERSFVLDSFINLIFIEDIFKEKSLKIINILIFY